MKSVTRSKLTALITALFVSATGCSGTTSSATGPSPQTGVSTDVGPSTQGEQSSGSGGAAESGESTGSGESTRSGQSMPAGQSTQGGQPASCDSLRAKYPTMAGMKVVVGSNPGPNNYDHPDPNDPSKTAGIEPDLLTAAGECLGFTHTVKLLDFNGLIPALQANNINLIASGMYASDERAKQVTFVQYMKAFEASIVQKGNPKSLDSLESMCGTTASETVGTVENAIIDKQSKKCVSDGKEAIKVLTFQTDLQSLNAVSQQRADVFLTDSGVVKQYTEKVPRTQNGFNIPSDFVFGIGVNKKNNDLSDALHGAFSLLYKDGTMLKIAQKWGFSDNQIVMPELKS